MVTIEERFQAAVNVIKGLPKDGPYQPSTAMMLKFYGLFKQATEGPCSQKKPAFWDIIGKAKWDAWKKNHSLSKEQAMQQYVDGLQEIIETMSFTENVQNFVGSMSGFDNINLDELEMIVPGMRQMAESHPNSPFHSRTNSPQHNGTPTGSDEEVNEVKNIASQALANGHVPTSSLLNGHSSLEDSTVTPPPSPVQQNDQAQLAQQQQQLEKPFNIDESPYVDQSDDEYGDPFDMNHEVTEALMHNSELLKQVQATVLRMNADLVTINQRMGLLEKSVVELRTSVASKASPTTVARRSHPVWWPFKDISPAWFALLVLWPFLASRLSRLMFGQRRK